MVQFMGLLSGLSIRRLSGQVSSKKGCWEQYDLGVGAFNAELNAALDEM
jgi:hypothetical protein